MFDVWLHLHTVITPVVGVVFLGHLCATAPSLFMREGDLYVPGHFGILLDEASTGRQHWTSIPPVV